jgi:ribonuclease HII
MQSIERILIDAGIRLIAGVDEAGRGACAGPLVVAAVILRDPFAAALRAVRDSKELSAAMREKLFDLIVEQALAISVIEISSFEIDERGVHAANLAGMRRAVQGLICTPEYVLTDGYAIPGLGSPSLGVWKGDQVVHTISAASIIAKVTRDRIMQDIDGTHPEYGFSSNKGYSTSAHMAAIQKFGVLSIHRRSFSNVASLINT